MTFGVCIYSLAGLLIPIRLWVCLRDVRRVVMATHAGGAGTVVPPSDERVGEAGSLVWALGEETRLGYMLKDCSKLY